jgi:nucleoside-diphosphate-sugar epimerase/phytoene/squalene synthetase
VRRALYDTFDAALAASARGDAGAAALADFERRSAAQGLGQSETERELCRGAGAVFRAFASLPEAQRRAIEPRVAEMSRGMRSYSERADREGGLRLRDLADLERYCYFVAGTVGELLTDLFALSCHVDSARLAELEARAVSFGLGLQLVNILKDVADDAARGDCFLPVLSAEQHGLDLRRVLEPSERTKGIALLRALSARAREHLTKAEEYTLLWPAGASAPAGGQVRLFCAVPLALALGTLREVELADDALVVGRAPTVSRAFVMAVFERAVRAATAETHAESDAELCALFEKARAGVAGRPQRPAGAARAAADNDRPRGITTSTRGSEMNESKEVSPPNSRPHGRALQPRRELGGKVLVTGAAGHVGANLLHRLLSEGRDVRVFLRERSNNEAVDAIERELGRKVERVYGDLRHLRDVVPAVRGCENVFHVAARVSTLSGKPRDLRDLYECNVIGTANVLRAAGETGVKRTVVTGSFSAVGFDPEDPSKPNDESVPFYPFVEHLPYGRTKMQVEHEVLKACVEGVDAVIATSCAVLGPWDYKPSRMGKTLLDFSHGKLNAYLPGGFDFVAARDIVEGHILAMERGRTGQKYIISTQFVTVDELMDIFEEVTCRPRPKLRLPPTIMAGIAHVSSFVLSNLFPDVQQRFTPGAVRILRMERKADTTKAQVELGYKPSSIRAAIHEAYAHFAKRGLAPQPPSLTAGGDEAPRAAQKKKEADREGAAA